MTNNKGFVNPRILATLVIAASLLVVTTGSQNAMATPDPADVIVEEVVEAGNGTMTGAENQTADGNMTETNSTS